MTTFTEGKPSPNRHETKNASLAMKSRQQVLNEVNKRRTLLQDNSWIKKRPEEENADENYGKVVLNQYKSQDSLHRNVDEKDDQKALLSRYRSDTTLNRISGGTDADKVNKLSIFDSRPGNSKGSGVTDNDLSPVKKKRQSWMPPPVSSQKPLTDDSEVHKRTPSTSDKSGGQKMIVYSSDPAISPKLNAVVNDPTRTRQICPRKPSESVANKTTTAERTGRQELDNLIEVKAKGNKSDKRERDLDDFIDVKNAAQRNRRSQDLDDLIVAKASTVDPDKKRRQDLDNMIEVSVKGDKSDKRRQDLDNMIEVSVKGDKSDKRGRDLDDLIDVKNTAQKNRRSQDLDDFIVTKSSTVEQNIKQTSGQSDAAADIPGNQSDKTHSYQTKGSSSFPRDAYEDSVSGKSIKTVYSTSDRAVIDNEMCTYCRKPLGTDTKMILDALQICCHATCFKCEVCKEPLENLKAGDSIWIYKNTVHCSPCYSDVKASWVY